MRFLYKIELFLFVFLYTGMVFIFMQLLKAEGFTTILLIWTSCVVVLCYFSSKNKIKQKKLRLFINICYRVIVAVGVISILFQLGAVQRSFAEAWLEAAKTGDAFGFFSFFVAELYAVLLIPFISEAIEHKWLSALCRFATIHMLFAGVIIDNQILLFCAFLPMIILAIVKKIWKPFVLPILCASIVSLLIAVGGIKTGKTITDVFQFDLINLMSIVAPDFPLMAYIPGYGSKVHFDSLQYSVSLSTQTLYTVRAVPLKAIYFASEKFSSWNGKNWNRFYSEDENNVEIYYAPETPTDLNNHRFLVATQLTVLNDFSSIVPCTLNTVAVQLPAEYKKARIEFDGSNVFSINPSLRRGNKILLYEPFLTQSSDSVFVENSENKTFEENIEPSLGVQNIDNNSIISSKILKLALSLGADIKTDEDRRSYIKNVLAYLKDGFIYSLETSQPKENEDPYEYFLFSSKKGFCSWYAGAFTLLMHAAKIPCRIVEGYRVVTDEIGYASISGMQAHAWPEVYIDGAWRLFESTAVYTSDDPFSYIQPKDKKTIKQLESALNATFPDSSVEESKSVVIDNVVFIFAISVAFVLISVFLLLWLLKRKSLEYQAKRIVKKYEKKGIQSPSKTGWLLWKNSVAQIAQTADEKKASIKALFVADKMMSKLYEQKN